MMRTDWRLVGLLFIIGLLAAAQFGKVSLGLDPLGRIYDRSETDLALAVSLVGVTGILFGATAGAVVAQFGARFVLLGALFLGASLSCFQALMPAYPLFLLSRVVEGVSHLALVVSVPTLMASIAQRRDRSVVMGIWGMFFGVSFAITAAALPWALPHIGLSGIYLAHACGLIISALLVWPLLPRSTPIYAAVGWIELHRCIYSNVRISVPALSFFWHTLIFVALLTFLAKALDAAWLAPLLPLISLVGTFAAGVLARYFAPDVIARAAFVATIICIMIFLATESIVLIFILFFAIGVVPGASFAAIPFFNQTEADQARANGAVAQLGNVGTASGTPLFAAILSLWGLNGMLWLALGISFAGFVVLTWTASVVRRQEV